MRRQIAKKTREKQKLEDKKSTIDKSGGEKKRKVELEKEKMQPIISKRILSGEKKKASSRHFNH